MRSQRGAAVLLVAAFVVGVLCGAGGVLVAERNGGIPLDRRGGRGPGGYLGHLTRELSLTPVQRDSVRAVLDRHRPAMDSLRREVAPRFETLQETIRSDIRMQLTTEQQGKLATMTRRFDSMRTRVEGSHGPR